MKRQDDPNQTLIDWGNPAAAAVAPKASIPDPIKLAAQARAPLVERLPWDFTTTFPQPTEEALETGEFLDEDNHPENIKAIHDEHARELLIILHDRDAVLDAKRRGVDPATDKPPRTHASRERSRRLYESEPARLDLAFNGQMVAYEYAFGSEAAHAFNRFIVARHAGITVEIDTGTRPLQSPSSDSPEVVCPPQAKRRNHPGSSSLPVPQPLAEAVKAGDFGIEDGKPINPSADEVRAITEQYAEKIIALLDGRLQMERSYTAPQCADRTRVEAEAAKLKDLVQAEIDKYTASFGDKAAKQLERHCRRQHRQR